MLELQYIRNNKKDVVQRLAIRGINAEELVSQVLQMDESRRTTQQQHDDVLAKMNAGSKKIGELFREGKRDEAEQIKLETAALKETAHQMNQQLSESEANLKDILLQIPNAPNPSVPKGREETDNEIVFQVEELPTLPDGCLAHWDIMKKYNLVDMELGVKITGAGFPVYKGKGARFQRALINYFLDQAIDAGYLELIPPLLVNAESAYGTGQLPDKEGQMYHARDDDFYLIPTAEVPITNVYRDTILEESDFPIKMVGYTPCFRREAGSYGKDVKGLNRVHQFDKVEIVQIQHPEKSYETLNQMVKHVEGLLNKLGLPYRIAKLCGGDLSFASALTFDMEVYSAGQGRWLEVSSISNFETFQSNRLKLRYKDENKKKHLAHTLNGSALALPRIVAALLENNQTESGVVVPEVLRPYTGFDIIN